MIIDDYFTTKGIDIDAVMSDIFTNMPNMLFSSNRSEIYQLTIPAYTDTIKYEAFKFPDTVYIKQMLNGFDSKTDDNSIIYDTVQTTVLVTDKVISDDFVFCRHGNVYIIDRLEDARVVYVKVTSVYRTADYVNEDIVLAIQNMYYSVVTRNQALGYDSMTLFSDLFNNWIAANTRTVPLMEVEMDTQENYEL